MLNTLYLKTTAHPKYIRAKGQQRDG